MDMHVTKLTYKGSEWAFTSPRERPLFSSLQAFQNSDQSKISQGCSLGKGGVSLNSFLGSYVSESFKMPSLDSESPIGSFCFQFNFWLKENERVGIEAQW